jgi:hypothetical protein
MFKSLAGRALVPVGIAVTGFVVVCFLLLYSAIKNIIDRDSIVNATNLADTVLKSTRYAMLKNDNGILTTIISNVGQQKGVEHIRIFNKKGIVNISTQQSELNHQVDKSAEGCIICHAGKVPVATLGKMEQVRTFKNARGEEIISITTPIYNEPECSNASCHVHPAGQKVLGTLDIGLSRKTLMDSLASIRNQMIVFTPMILLLTVGGVTALLMRSIFVPLQRLSDLARQAEEECGLTVPPAHFPRELDRIAQSIYNLSRKLRSARKSPDSEESGSGHDN